MATACSVHVHVLISQQNEAFVQSLYGALHSKTTHYILYNNQRDSKHKNGDPKSILLHLNNMFRDMFILNNYLVSADFINVECGCRYCEAHVGSFSSHTLKKKNIIQ